MDFTNTWDEASPPGTEFARNIDDHMRKSKVDVRERGGVEHITYANEGTNLDVWEHKPGQCKVAYVGTKATFPLAGKKGALAIATDENNSVYFDDGTTWIKNSRKYAQVQADDTVYINNTDWTVLPGMIITNFIPGTLIQITFNCNVNTPGGVNMLYFRLVLNTTIFPLGTYRVIGVDIPSGSAIYDGCVDISTLQILPYIPYTIEIQCKSTGPGYKSVKDRILSVVEI